MKKKTFCPSFDQCRLQYDDINARCYMKKSSIIDNINPPKLKIARRVCNVLNRCFDIRGKKST